ncbi:uncharacterized protein LOC100186047 [Ciona intestinalis]
MQKMILLFLVSLFIVCEAGTCSIGRREARKRQISRISNLQETQVVVDAKYIGSFDDGFRFVVQQTWSKHNGGLRVMDEITVQSNDEKLTTCFGELRMGDAYILMLQPASGEGIPLYDIIEPAVESRKPKHRHRIYESLCEEIDGVCLMRVNMPGREILYRNSMMILQCAVESVAEVTSVTWYKDGSEVNTPIYKKAGLFVQENSLFDSVVVVTTASQVHNGRYQCVAENAAGQSATGTTAVVVLGPNRESHFTTCADPSYCMNGGTCRVFIGDVTEPLCECPGGFMGERCEITDEDFTLGGPMGVGSAKDMEDQLSKMTITVIVMSASLVCIVIFAIVYVTYMRRKLAPQKVLWKSAQLKSETTELNAAKRSESMKSNNDIESGGRPKLQRSFGQIDRRSNISDSRPASTLSFSTRPRLSGSS